MELISFLGIILGLTAFITMCFKKYNMLLTAVTSASVMIIFSGTPSEILTSGFYIEQLTGTYMGGVAGFLKGYLILFALSALYGKVMEDSGAVRKIALALSSATKASKNNQKFLTVCILPLFYVILGYCGISGFVVVFTVVALGRELFEECDIPWKYYCYGSAGNIANGVLAGNLQAQNIQACQIFGVGLSAAVGMSIVFCTVQLAALAALIWCDIKKSERRGEGFLPSGAEIKKMQLALPRQETDCPSLLLSALPLIVTVFCIAAAGINVLLTLALSILVSFVIFKNRLADWRDTLGKGITAAVGPVISVAAAAGLASVIAAAPGFKIIANGLSALPHMYAGMGLIMAVTLFTANPVPVFSAFGDRIAEYFTQAGLSPEVGARLALCAEITPCPPWNAGVVNAVALTRIDFRSAAWYYFKGSFFSGLAGLTAVIILIAAGLF